MSQRESTPWRRHLNRLATTLADVLFPVPPIPPYCYGGFGDVDIDQAEQLADYEACRDHLDPHALVCFRCGLDPITCTHDASARPESTRDAAAGGVSAGPDLPGACTHCHTRPGVVDRDYFNPGADLLCAGCAREAGPLDPAYLLGRAADEIEWLVSLLRVVGQVEVASAWRVRMVADVRDLAAQHADEVTR